LGVAPNEVGVKYPEGLVLLQNRIRRENAVAEMKRLGQILKKGDQVRVRIAKGVFDKGSTAQFSKELHTILKRRGTRYFLEGDESNKPYTATELLRVEQVQENPYKGQAEERRERRPRDEKVRARQQKKAAKELADFLQAPVPEKLPDQRERRPSRRLLESSTSR
jgi:hypothetical protein